MQGRDSPCSITNEWHGSIYMHTAIRLTVPLAEMIVTIGVIPQPEISFESGSLILEHMNLFSGV